MTFAPGSAAHLVRLKARSGALSGPTANLVPGFVQANLAILPHDPAEIGIKDVARPDYGDAVRIEAGEIPVFWACGVPPQAAIAKASPLFSITHAPGHMLVTDRVNAALSI